WEPWGRAPSEPSLNSMLTGDISAGGWTRWVRRGRIQALPHTWTGHDPLRLSHPAVGADRLPGRRTVARVRTAVLASLVAGAHRTGPPGTPAPRRPSRHGLPGEDVRPGSVLRIPAPLCRIQHQDPRDAAAVGGTHTERRGGHRQRR